MQNELDSYSVTYRGREVNPAAVRNWGLTGGATLVAGDGAIQALGGNGLREKGGERGGKFNQIFEETREKIL